ncbi:hypothetical protein [Saccharopolyspora hattusasensis]|uniref:hypothetical protein n=1 Tax=Saccharopolyspora hattusasensis TaxID=1128679 RepID=UPI003D99DFC6
MPQSSLLFVFLGIAALVVLGIAGVIRLLSSGGDPAPEHRGPHQRGTPPCDRPLGAVTNSRKPLPHQPGK